MHRREPSHHRCWDPQLTEAIWKQLESKGGRSDDGIAHRAVEIIKVECELP